MKKYRCAIMFVDICDSTRLYEQLGNEIAKQCIGACLDRLSGITQAHDGIVVKTIGDEIMCRFDDVDSAVDAARSSQLGVQLLQLHDDTQLAIRVGIHFGDVIEDHDDIFGDAVNIAARMAGIARAGQIITTLESVGNLAAPLDSEVRQIDLTRVKGKSERIAVYEVLWEQDGQVTRIFSRPPLQVENNTLKLELHCGSVRCALESESATISIGRRDDCDLIIDAALVSRHHASCELRRGKFVITDQSTNGTYVAPDGADEVYLRREELVLQGQGSISLGKPAAECDTVEVIHYRC